MPSEEEVAAGLGISITLLRSKVQAGIIPCTRVPPDDGPEYVFDPEDLEDYHQENLHKACPDTWQPHSHTQLLMFPFRFLSLVKLLWGGGYLSSKTVQPCNAGPHFWVNLLNEQPVCQNVGKTAGS